MSAKDHAGPTVGIVGQGYVGLSLTFALCKRGIKVIGFEVDEIKLQKILSNTDVESALSTEELNFVLNSGLYVATSDESRISECDVVILAVPTPLSNKKTPNLDILVSACRLISPHLKMGTLLINESTSFPGTLRNIIIPIVEDSCMKNSTQILFACSPERVNPGDAIFRIENTPRIVAGVDKYSTKAVKDFYSLFVESVIVVSSPEVAEMSKLLENSYRLVNISFINEIANYCQQKRISIREVINAASSKPFGFAAFFPSLGVGGHCIPVDPEYLLHDARNLGVDLRILEMASMSNFQRGELICKAIEISHGEMKNKKILIVGISYKANIADVRESPAKEFVYAAQNRGAVVEWFDPLIENWKFAARGELIKGKYDFVVVSSLHDVINKELLLNLQVPIFDFSGKLPKTDLVFSI